MNVNGEIRLHLDKQVATLRYSESRSSLSIDVVLVPPAFRGRGIGRALIDRVLLLADASHRETHLSARPIGSSDPKDLERLVRYYESMGFQVVDRGVTAVQMRRPPREPRDAPYALLPTY